MAKSKPQTLPTTQSAALRSLSVLEVSPSANNPRKQFNDADLADLAASVAKVGIMQPILVRPDADGYEIVCGERRYRAAVLAGLTEVPCIVRTLTDDEAFHIAITENLQRKDINPMEESDAFFQLTKRGKTSAAKIADMLGVGEKYVYDRLALQRCIPVVQEQIRNGSLPITHGKQFARLTFDDQQQLYDQCASKAGGITLTDIKRNIENTFERNLEEAPFNIKNPSLYEQAGACTNCPKRSGCNALLFDDVQSKDVCFDADCYAKKVELHIASIKAQLLAEGKIVHEVTAAHHSDTYMGTKMFVVAENGATPDAYGIVMDTYSWSSWKIGEVLPINMRSIATPAISSTEDSSTQVRQPHIDHDDEFLKVVVSSLVDTFKENRQRIVNYDIRRKKLAHAFYSNTSDKVLDYIFEQMGFELVMQDGSVDRKETLVKAMATPFIADSMFFMDMMFIIDELEKYGWDDDAIESKQSKIDDLLDLAALRTEYQTKHNHTF